MSPWTKKTALAELEELIREIPNLANQRRYGAKHMFWLTKTLALLDEVFGRRSRYYVMIESISWGKSDPIIVGGPNDVEGVMDPGAAIEREHQRAYIDLLDSAKGVLQGAVNHLQKADEIDSVYEGKDTPPESSIILKIINLAEYKLRKIVRDIPTREKDIQDAFENLLIGADIAHSREADSIEYSSKTYKPDFTVSKIDLAVDLKLCAREGREKEIIGEINDDILAYQTKYGNVLFIIYDVGLIRDVEQFTGAFETHPSVVVRIVKH